jgi:glycerol uptake facilitator-like aquaporin
MLSTVFLYEVLGTATLLLLGCGVVANVALAKSKGEGGGFLLVNFGWGIAVFAGVYVAWKSGAHLNPAVTLGLLASGADAYGPDIDVTFATTITYIAAQLVGAFLGAVLCWLAYKNHFDETLEPESQLGVFSTGPAIRNPVWNVVTEVIGTFVLVYVILQFGNTPARSDRWRSPCWSSASARPSAVRPATPSTRPVTWAAHRPRRPAHPWQGRQRLGILLDTGRRPGHRRRPRRSGRPGRRQLS